MGLVHYIGRLSKSITNSVASREKSTVIFYCDALLIGRCFKFGSSRSICTFTDQIFYKNPIFLNNELLFSENGIPLTPHRLVLQVGFHKTFHLSDKTQFLVEPTTSETLLVSVNKKISEDADKICRMLSNQSVSNIRTSLDDAGLRLSPDIAAEVLKKLSNAGMVALSFFRWAEKQENFTYTTEIFHHLMDALGKIKQFRLIWSLVESMKQRGLLTKETFGLISRRYARARKIREAIEAFEKMETFGLKPDLADYNGFIDTISKSKNVVRAQEILYDLKRRRKFSPDLKTYTILIEGWGQERNLTRMKEVYDEMIKENFEPDVVTYGILVNAFCKSGNCDEALVIFHKMEEKGCKPSPHIYCTLINGLGSQKRLDEALKYFELSKESGHPPEIPTYNAVVGSYCWALRFEDAFKVVDKMQNQGIGPNARTFDIILHHLIKVGHSEEAYKVFQNMSTYRDCEPQLNTYTMMISMLCAEERVDIALKVWREMNEKGVLPCMHMFSALINGLCYENRMDEACKYFQEMLDKGIRPSGQLFSKLKETLIEGGKKDLAYMMSMKLDKLRKKPLNG
ncbi:pentatricopeptide repeat-containing protein At1g71060, mitochondrial isoform X2 [Dendrobium catenatum]|uniref:Pentatricopeptide repeat-containing protein n=2 Tax=Dendrobium catenatum TaxID=906689 RepID=A0A2I0XHK7_9ASPA|nr:pentatricopeptide repeat-containing protein At1g71060, mitochondrial isoform X2 [Dendrobium catenatum]PKU87364.1 Pentatricopeptide repeat-containing protein [Dendrobium catenatum]